MSQKPDPRLGQWAVVRDYYPDRFELAEYIGRVGDTLVVAARSYKTVVYGALEAREPNGPMRIDLWRVSAEDAVVRLGTLTLAEGRALSALLAK